ncbi:hypothetical protein BsWGS_12648 [Bradybaena similaris]
MRFSCLVDRLAGRLALRMSRKTTVVLLLCLFMSLYAMLSLVSKHFLQHDPWYKHPAPCVTPKYIMDEMVMMTFAVSNILTKLNISHALCYGTLWGALRYGRTLPWDNNVNFCVLKTEIQKVSWEWLQETFQANHMGVTYNLRQGEYLISRGPAQAVITVFYQSHSEARLDGLGHKLLGFFYKHPVSFPSRLLKAPFSKIVFHGKAMPIPHEDVQILKHLYPEDWWLEKPPPGCSSVQAHSSLG